MGGVDGSSDGIVELALVRRLRQQLGDVTGEVSLNVTITLRSAAKGIRRVEIGVVIDLDERLKRDAEALAIVEQTAMVERDPPRPGIEIEPGIEAALLHRAVQLDVAVTAAQRPAASASSSRIFKHLDGVAGLARLAAAMPASPAPSTRTEAPLGSPSSTNGPR